MTAANSPIPRREAGVETRSPAPGVLLSDGERLTELEDLRKAVADFCESEELGDLGQFDVFRRMVSKLHAVESLAQQLHGDPTARLANAATDSWQGIETAPKDGMAILLYWQVGGNKIQAIGRWTRKQAENEWGWWTDGNQWPDPELWQPLPTPPSAQAKGEPK